MLEKHLQKKVTRCALISYSFAECTDKNEKLDPEYLVWAPVTHRHFDDYTKKKVITTLLCFKRICLYMPKDIRNYILRIIFSNDF